MKKGLILLLVELMLLQPLQFSFYNFIQSVKAAGTDQTNSFDPIKGNADCYSVAQNWFTENDPQKREQSSEIFDNSYELVTSVSLKDYYVPTDGGKGAEDFQIGGPFRQVIDIEKIKEDSVNGKINGYGEVASKDVIDKITSDDYIEQVMRYMGGGVAHYTDDKVNYLVLCPNAKESIDTTMFNPIIPLGVEVQQLFEMLLDPTPKIVFEEPRDYWAMVGEDCYGGFIASSNSNPCPSAFNYANSDSTSGTSSNDIRFRPEDDKNGDHEWTAPQVDRRVLETLVYLTTPIALGGAGREHIRVKQIISYNDCDQLNPNGCDSTGKLKTGTSAGTSTGGPQSFLNKIKSLFTIESAKAADVTDAAPVDYQAVIPPEGVSTPVNSADLQGSSETINVDPNQSQPAAPISLHKVEGPAYKPTKLAQAVQIDEIDQVRITTQTTTKKLFSSSTSYQYQKPFAIKVAWQTDAGLAKNPPPDVTGLSLLGNARINTNSAIVEMLNAYGLGDLEVDVSDTDINNFGDVATLVGTTMLEQIIGAPKGSFKGWSLASTLENIGLAYLEQDLGLVPGALGSDDSSILSGGYDAIVQNIGRRTLEQSMGLVSGSLKTKTGSSQELLSQLGRRYLEKSVFRVSEDTLVPSAQYPVTKVSDMLERLGEGRLEYVFKLPKQSTRVDTYQQLRTSNYKAGLLFGSGTGTSVDDLSMEEYVASQLSLGYTAYKVNGVDTGHDMYGFTLADYKSSVTKLQQNQNSTDALKKFKQLIGSRTIQMSLGIFKETGQNNVANGDTTITNGGKGTRTISYALNKPEGTQLIKVLGKESDTKVVQLSDILPISVDNRVDSNWCDSARIPQHQTGGLFSHGTSDYNCSTNTYTSKENDALNYLNTVFFDTTPWQNLSLLDGQGANNTSTLTTLTNAMTKAETNTWGNDYAGFTDKDSSVVSMRGNSLRDKLYNYYLDNTRVDPLHPLNGLIKAQPISANVPTYDANNNPTGTNTSYDLTEANVQTVASYLAEQQSSGILKNETEINQRIAQLQSLIATKKIDYFNLDKLVDANGNKLTGTALDQELVNRLNLIEAYPDATADDFPAQYSGYFDTVGVKYLINDISQRIEALKQNADAVIANDQTTGADGKTYNHYGLKTIQRNRENPLTAVDINYLNQVQDYLKTANNLFDQESQTLLQLLESGSVDVVSSTNGSSSTVLGYGGQSMMSSAIGLPGQILNADDNGKYNISDFGWRIDPVRALFAPVHTAAGYIEKNAYIAPYVDASGNYNIDQSVSPGTDGQSVAHEAMYEQYMETIGGLYASKQFTTDPLAQRNLIKTITKDATALQNAGSSFANASNKLFGTQISLSILKQKGLRDGDFERMFMLGLANDVYARIGKEELVRALWMRNKFGKSVQKSSGYNAMVGEIDAAARDMSFYNKKMEELDKEVNSLSDSMSNFTGDTLQGEYLPALKQLASELKTVNKTNPQTAGYAKDKPSTFKNIQGIAREYEPYMKQYQTAQTTCSKDNPTPANFVSSEYTDEYGNKVQLYDKCSAWFFNWGQSLKKIDHILSEIAAGKELPTEADGNSQNYAKMQKNNVSADCFNKADLIKAIVLGKNVVPGTQIFSNTQIYSINSTLKDYAAYVGTCNLDQSLSLPNGTTYIWYQMGQKGYVSSDETRLSSWSSDKWDANNLQIAAGLANQFNLSAQGKKTKVSLDDPKKFDTLTIEQLIDLKRDGDRLLKIALGLMMSSKLSPGLRKYLNDNSIGSNDLAALLQGDIKPVVGKIGGNALDQALNMKSGTGSQLIYPECSIAKYNLPEGTVGRRVIGSTPAPCNSTPGEPMTDPSNVRMQILASEGLRRLGLEIPDFPQYFDLTGSGNLQTNWGNARLSEDFALSPNSFSGKLTTTINANCSDPTQAGYSKLVCVNEPKILTKSLGLGTTYLQDNLTNIEKDISAIIDKYYAHGNSETLMDDTGSVLLQKIYKIQDDYIEKNRVESVQNSTTNYYYEAADSLTQVEKKQNARKKEGQLYAGDDGALSQILKAISVIDNPTYIQEHLSTIQNVDTMFTEMRDAVLKNRGYDPKIGSDESYMQNSYDTAKTTNFNNLNSSAQINSFLDQLFNKSSLGDLPLYGASTNLDRNYDTNYYLFQTRMTSLASKYGLTESVWKEFIAGTKSADEIANSVGNKDVTAKLISGTVDKWINEKGPDWLKEVADGFKELSKGFCGTNLANNGAGPGDGVSLGQFMGNVITNGHNTDCGFDNIFGGGTNEGITGRDLLYDETYKDFRIFMFDHILANTFSTKLEQNLDIQPGTFRSMMAEPKNFWQIALSQGILVTSNKIFGSGNRVDYTCTDSRCWQTTAKGVLQKAFVSGFYDPKLTNTYEVNGTTKTQKCSGDACYTLDFSVARVENTLRDEYIKAVDSNIRRTGKKYIGAEITIDDLDALLSGDMRVLEYIGLQYTLFSMNNNLDKNESTKNNRNKQQFKALYGNVRDAVGLGKITGQDYSTAYINASSKAYRDSVCGDDNLNVACTSTDSKALELAYYQAQSDNMATNLKSYNNSQTNVDFSEIKIADLETRLGTTEPAQTLTDIATYNAINAAGTDNIPAGSYSGADILLKLPGADMSTTQRQQTQDALDFARLADKNKDGILTVDEQKAGLEYKDATTNALKTDTPVSKLTLEDLNINKESVQQEAAVIHQKKAQDALKYTTMDRAAFMLDQNIPVGFSQRILAGNSSAKMEALSEYIFNSWASNDSEMAKFISSVGVTPEQFGAFTYHLMDAVFTSDPGARSQKLTDIFNSQDGVVITGMDSVLSNYVSDKLFDGKAVPQGMFKGLFAWLAKGAKPDQFNTDVCMKTGTDGKCTASVASIGKVLQDFTEHQFEGWLDKQAGMAPGTASKIIDATRAIINLVKFSNLGDVSKLTWGGKSGVIGEGNTNTRWNSDQGMKIKAAAYMIVKDLLLSSMSKTFTKMDTQLGLPQGMMSQVVGVGLDMLAASVGIISHAAFAAALPLALVGIALIAIFGVVKVVTVIKGTSDGYYPYYKYGTGPAAGSKQIKTYSANSFGSQMSLRSNINQVTGTIAGSGGSIPAYSEHLNTDPDAGEFDAKNTATYYAGLKKAAQTKVIALLKDLLIMPNSQWVKDRGLKPTDMWIGQVFTYQDDIFKPFSDSELQSYINQPAPWDNPPGTGYGTPQSRCSNLTDSTDSTTFNCAVNQSIRAGFWGDTRMPDAIYIAF